MTHIDKWIDLSKKKKTKAKGPNRFPTVNISHALSSRKGKKQGRKNKRLSRRGPANFLSKLSPQILSFHASKQVANQGKQLARKGTRSVHQHVPSKEIIQAYFRLDKNRYRQNVNKELGRIL